MFDFNYVAIVAQVRPGGSEADRGAPWSHGVLLHERFRHEFDKHCVIIQ